jgi:multidrug efflux system membrane fusion protein
MANLAKWVGGLVGVAALGAGGYWGYQQYQAQQAPAGAQTDAKGAPGAAGQTAAKDGKGDKGGKGDKAGKGGGRGAAAPVAVGMARSANVNIYQSGLGTVTPLRTVTVRSRVDGELLRINFTEGQTVKQGQLLAEIDPRPFQAQLLQAQGQMQRDQALLANARVDLDRYRTLLKQDSIAEQQVASQEALVRQLEGTVKIDQGQVDTARLQLTYSRVTAPINGQLGLRQVDQGNVVRSGDTNGIVVITQLKPITVLFTIPQDDLPRVLARLREGEKLPVEVFDRDQKVLLGRGRLLTADNQIDTTTGTVKLKAQLPNDEGNLFPNQFVNVRMLVDTRENAVTVPSSALQRGAQGIFVYVLNEDRTVSMRNVKIGPVDGTRIVIESGVSAGERVVIDGMDRLRDGMRVEVADRERAFKGDGTGKGKGKGRRSKGGDGSVPAETDKGAAAQGEAAKGDAAKGDGAAKDEKGEKGEKRALREGVKAEGAGDTPTKGEAGSGGRGEGRRERKGGDRTGKDDAAKATTSADIAKEAAMEGIKPDTATDTSKSAEARRERRAELRKKAKESE